MEKIVSEPTSNLRLEEIIKQVKGQSFPPVDKWNPDFCGDIDMRIAADGTWFYMGTPIGREKMVKLFASVLRKDDDDKTYLVTPVEKIGITVDDAPFVVTEMNMMDSHKGCHLHFITNVGDEVIVGAEHPLWVIDNTEKAEPRPYVRVRGRLDALISRSVFYELAEYAVVKTLNGKEAFFVESAGQFYRLGDLE
jgi:hypothetical protein